MLNTTEKLLARLASIIGIIFAASYWLLNQFTLGKTIICDYSLLLAGVLLIILIFYIFMIRATLKHIVMMKQHHVTQEDELRSRSDLGTKYAAILFEALLICSIMSVTIGGFVISAGSCAISSLL